MEEWTIDYHEYLSEWPDLDYDAKVEKLVDDFKSEWVYSYTRLKSVFGIPADLLWVQLNSFGYIYDCAQGANPADGEYPEPRVVVAFGRTNPQPVKRDDSRLRGWVGPTQSVFGSEWDKGHFIANSMGGKVDNHEINVFQQLRALNRGWSAQGKVFRKMEGYCSKNKDIFCFHRPIYFDLSAVPNLLEFGILLPDGRLQVEIFNNRTDIP